MRQLVRTAVGAVLVLGTAGALTACGSEGDLTVVNDGDTVATVDFGDEQAEVEPSGGVSLLGYGCSPGDVTVTVGDEETVLDGPVCPPDSIAVRDGGVVVVAATPSSGAGP